MRTSKLQVEEAANKAGGVESSLHVFTAEANCAGRLRSLSHEAQIFSRLFSGSLQRKQQQSR
jgi:hypothetical protein